MHLRPVAHQRQSPTLVFSFKLFFLGFTDRADRNVRPCAPCWVVPPILPPIPQILRNSLRDVRRAVRRKMSGTCGARAVGTRGLQALRECSTGMMRWMICASSWTALNAASDGWSSRVKNQKIAKGEKKAKTRRHACALLQDFFFLHTVCVRCHSEYVVDLLSRRTSRDVRTRWDGNEKVGATARREKSPSPLT